MKNIYIFSGLDSDGLLATATVLHHINDAFLSFTSPHTLHTELVKLLQVERGQLYIVGLPIDQSNYKEVFEQITQRPGVESFFFSQHRPPIGVSTDEMPFTHASIDAAVSSCENAYFKLESGLDIMIPAIASLHQGFRDTTAVKEAKEMHGERLYANADFIEFGLAFNPKDNIFRRQLVYAIKSGLYPESVEELVVRYKQGKEEFEKIKGLADNRAQTMSYIVYGEFPNLRGGYAKMLVKYLAESRQRPVGVSILETDRFIQKMLLISLDPRIDLGEVVSNLVVGYGGYGGGGTTIAGANLHKQFTQEFITKLNQRIAQYYQKS